MMLSCLFSCFHHIKQVKACFYLTYLNFFYRNDTATCSHKWNLKVRFSRSKILQINDLLLLQYKSFLISLISMLNTYPCAIDLLKVNNKQSKVKNKSTRMTFLFIIVLVSLMLALNRFAPIPVFALLTLNCKRQLRLLFL